MLRTIQVLFGKLLDGTNVAIGFFASLLYFGPVLAKENGLFLPSAIQPTLDKLSGYPFTMLFSLCVGWALVRAVHKIRVENGHFRSMRHLAATVSLDRLDTRHLKISKYMSPNGKCVYHGVVRVAVKSQVSTLLNVRINVSVVREDGALKALGKLAAFNRQAPTLNLSAEETALFSFLSIYSPDLNWDGDVEDVVVSERQVDTYLEHAHRHRLLLETDIESGDAKFQLASGKRATLYMDLYSDNAKTIRTKIQVTAPPEFGLHFADAKYVPMTTST